ncbi:ATP-dependent zinc metalloprotease FTSH 4 mitochondrial-like, partial [Trifolium medium]|nr:ATP-dependent zinc metalloprotease FTSH 4 mitochondrial-like [Trifolium medium]
MKNIFAAAKELSSCVIFFDDIDALGGNENLKDMKTALSQLLLELEGFKQYKEKPLIVIGATNRPNLLDKSLLKHGRFDRRVVVPYPDIEGRRQILNSHLSE